MKTHTIKTEYQKTIAPELAKRFNIENVMAIPRLEKIVISAKIGEALTDKKVVEKMSEQLAVITGQKPQLKKARKAIAAFKLRIGDPVGLKVTLRGKRMYDFLSKLIGIALPRVRDFRGIPAKSFDGNGNYSLGVKEQTIFPDLEYGMVDKVRGFEATFVTTAENDEQAKALLELLGLPFEKEEARS